MIIVGTANQTAAMAPAKQVMPPHQKRRSQIRFVEHRLALLLMAGLFVFLVQSS